MLADDHLAPRADAMIADEHQRPWLLQQSAMHVVDDATHRVHWEAPDAVARIIACVLQ
jgi:pimeloyl-ACP methyl ester carboxylesterase